MGTEKSNVHWVERQSLRKKILAERDNLTPEEINSKSESIVTLVLELNKTRSAKTVFTYMHFRSEVQTTSLIHKMFSIRKNVYNLCNGFWDTAISRDYQKPSC